MNGLTDKLDVPFVIDGTSFENSDILISAITRSFSVTDGANAGRDMDGEMMRDIIGTFFNYKIDFRSKAFSPEAYETLVEILSAPVDYHLVSFPFGNKTITQKMYVTSGSDSLKRFRANGDNQFDGLSIDAIAIKPFLKP